MNNHFFKYTRDNRDAYRTLFHFERRIEMQLNVGNIKTNAWFEEKMYKFHVYMRKFFLTVIF